MSRTPSKNTPACLGVGFAMVTCTTAALAGTARQDLAVTATVVNGCTIKGPAADRPVSVSCNSIVSYSLHRHEPRTTSWATEPGTDIVVVTVTF
jgi:spore coat protein U-like protein